MTDILKKVALASVGIVLKTKEEVEAIASDIAKKAELSENEGKKFVNDFMKRYEEAKSNLEDRVDNTIKKILEKANLATRVELETLKKEVDKLKKNKAVAKK